MIKIKEKEYPGHLKFVDLQRGAVFQVVSDEDNCYYLRVMGTGVANAVNLTNALGCLFNDSDHVYERKNPILSFEEE